MTDLLSCPFCGGEAEIIRRGDARRSTQYGCTECGCFLETSEEWNHGADWNRRASRPTPSPDPAELIRLAEAWVEAEVKYNIAVLRAPGETRERAAAVDSAATAFRDYVATLAPSHAKPEGGE